MTFRDILEEHEFETIRKYLELPDHERHQYLEQLITQEVERRVQPHIERLRDELEEAIQRQVNGSVYYALFNPCEHREVGHGLSSRLHCSQGIVPNHQPEVQTVKIGYSMRPRERLMHIGGTALAIEPGARAVETDRHHRFQHLRIGYTERFYLGPDLWEHIETVATQFPDLLPTHRGPK